MRSHILPVRQNQPRLYNSKVRGLPKRADPPLRARQRRRVDIELVGFWDVRRGRFELCDVRAVTKFGLEVAPEDAAVFDECAELGFELFGALEHHDRLER